MRGGEMEFLTVTNNISSGNTTWEIWDTQYWEIKGEFHA
jgi:hypothetical protein